MDKIHARVIQICLLYLLLGLLRILERCVFTPLIYAEWL